VAFPSRDFGGTGEPLHFLHANGYPPDCYLPLINHLASKYHVFGMLMRPLWEGSKPEELFDWQPLSDDLNQYIAATCRNDSLIGVGHSLGAIVTLRSALQAPHNFRALILLDPVLFSPTIIHGWKLVKMLGLGYKVHPLIPAARQRKRHFENHEVIYQAYRSKKVFRHIEDEYLKVMINGLLKPSKNLDFELAYSPEWEIQIYYTGVASDEDIWRGLPDLKTPMLIIRGSETNTFYPSTAARIKRLRPETQVVTIDKSTHLVPLERPDELAKIIFNFLEKTT
jgi:pimeloyl-ACP methyl ester carboxylesterase